MKQGQWSTSYCPDFVKQTYKAAKVQGPATASTARMVGEPLRDDPLLPHLMRLCEQRGWHDFNGTGVNVARNAKSFRTPTA